MGLCSSPFHFSERLGALMFEMRLYSGLYSTYVHIIYCMFISATVEVRPYAKINATQPMNQKQKERENNP